MTILKYKDLSNISKADLEEKLKDLKLELVKANVTANKSNSKTKEIKKAISRLLTFNRSMKDQLKKK
ncbi:MAG: 50S ribosomal protein L29 [Nanoarchaeota archaeon]